MIKGIKFQKLFFFFSIFCFFAFEALAFEWRLPEVNYPKLPIPGVLTPQEIAEKVNSKELTQEEALSRYVLYFYYLFLSLAGILAFLAIIAGGIRYLTSTGSPPKLVLARNQIVNGIFGILLLLSAGLISTYLNPELRIWKVSVTKAKICSHRECDEGVCKLVFDKPEDNRECPNIPNQCLSDSDCSQTKPIAEYYEVPLGRLVETVLYWSERVKEEAESLKNFAAQARKGSENVMKIVQDEKEGCFCENVSPPECKGGLICKEMENFSPIGGEIDLTKYFFPEGAPGVWISSCEYFKPIPLEDGTYKYQKSWDGYGYERFKIKEGYIYHLEDTTWARAGGESIVCADVHSDLKIRQFAYRPAAFSLVDGAIGIGMFTCEDFSKKGEEGGKWVPTKMNVGQTFQTTLTVISFPREPRETRFEGDSQMKLQLLKKDICCDTYFNGTFEHQMKLEYQGCLILPNGILRKDAIVLHDLTHDEYFYYDIKLGWIGFQWGGDPTKGHFLVEMQYNEANTSFPETVCLDLRGGEKKYMKCSSTGKDPCKKRDEMNKNLSISNCTSGIKRELEQAKWQLALAKAKLELAEAFLRDASPRGLSYDEFHSLEPTERKISRFEFWKDINILDSPLTPQYDDEADPLTFYVLNEGLNRDLISILKSVSFDIFIRRFDPPSRINATPKEGAIVITPFPYFSQRDYLDIIDECDSEEDTIYHSGCGPTSLAMVLKYFNNDIDPKKLAEELKTNKNCPTCGWSTIEYYCGVGSVGENLMKKARDYNVDCGNYPIEFNIEIIKRELENNHPIIVHWKNYLTLGVGHFAVIYGIYAKEGENPILYIRDPWGGESVAFEVNEISAQVLDQMWVCKKMAP